MDPAERLEPKRRQAGLRGGEQPDVDQVGRACRHDHRHRGEADEHGDPLHVRPAGGVDPPVDGLLHADRHDHPADGRQRSQRHRHPDALKDLRGQAETPLDRLPRATGGRGLDPLGAHRLLSCAARASRSAASRA